MINERARALGRKLQELRHRAGLTQEQLAVRADITANFVAHLERGSRRPSLDTLLDLTTALGVSMGTLFGEADMAAGRESPELQQLCRLLRKVPPSKYPALTDLANSFLPEA